jgi:hypothetical protein
MKNFVAQKYSRQELWSLFLTCAFPLHMWALIMAFRDISWLSERTGLWDAIAVVAYGMLIAFVESVLVFLVVALVGFFTPGTWSSERRTTFMSLLILLLALWAIISQLLYLWDVDLPPSAVRFLRNSGHPLRILYAGSLAVVGLSIALPVYSFIRSQRAVPFMKELMDRFSTLTTFYLALDLLGVVIIIIRNLN